MTARMLRLLAALLALALLAAACGDDSTETADGGSDHDHDSHAHESGMADGDHDHEDHGGVEFEGDTPPTIDVEVTSDPAGGINVFVTTEHFTVAPEAASTDHVDGEGHFHLSVDGEKVMRFYNSAVYVSGVPEGEVDVMVELSANDHRAYAVGGEPIVAMTTFTVPEHGHDDHDHGEAMEVEFDGPAPELGLTVEADPKSGYNAFVTLDGMVLSAQNASGDHVDGEGHLHIYVNGQKLGRLYGLATHIPVLPDGDVEIRVAAYTNDHMVYVAGGEPVDATTTIEVDG